MTMNDILQQLVSASNLLSLIVTVGVAVLILKLRGDFAIFRSRLMEDMEKKFLAKPAAELDHPLSRREFQDFVLGAKEHRLSMESQLNNMRELEKRIRDLELEARLARKP